MTRTYRLDRHIRNNALWCLPFFGLITMAHGAAGYLVQPLAEAVPLLALLPFWGGWTLLSTYLLVAYWRVRLVVDDNKVVEQGVFRTTCIQFKDVVEVTWKPVPRRGKIVLRTSQQSLAIPFQNYQHEKSLELIRHLRRVVPRSVQREWPLFCQKVAVPLRDGCIRTDPGKGKVRLTRRRYDRLFVGVFPITLLAAFIGWWFQYATVAILPVVTLLFWLLVRYSIPKKGMIDTRIAENTEIRTLLIYSAIILALLPFMGMLSPACLALVVVAWCVSLGWALYGHVKERQRLERKAEPKAAYQWEEGEMQFESAKATLD